MCINWNSSSIGEQRKSNIISKKDNVSFRRNGRQTNNRVDLINPEVSFGKLKDKKRRHKLSVSEIKKKIIHIDPIDILWTNLLKGFWQFKWNKLLKSQLIKS